MTTTASECRILTTEEAATVLGVALNTIRTYTRLRRLTRADGLFGHAACGKPATFREEDVLPLRGLAERHQERRADRRSVALTSGVRECTGPCARSLSLDLFAPQKNGFLGRKSRCEDCLRESAREFARLHHAERCDYKRQWRVANRERVKADKRERSRKITEEGGPALQRRHAYFRRYHAYRQAIDDGKRSAICRAYGFSLVVNQAGEYAARRLDKPLQTGERAIAHFDYFHIDGRGKWIVNAPPLRSAEPCLLETLQASSRQSPNRRKVGKS